MHTYNNHNKTKQNQNLLISSVSNTQKNVRVSISDNKNRFKVSLGMSSGLFIPLPPNAPNRHLTTALCLEDSQ